MENLKNIIESILFVAGNAVLIKDISEKLNITDKEVLETAKELQNDLKDTGINLLVFNKKLQLCSNPNFKNQVSDVLNPIKERELSRAMMEVAAIVAYKQPVTRIDMENLRGLNCDYAVTNLLELGVIEPVGRKEAVGRPVLYGTTDEFLKRFQISSLDELPDYEELLRKVAEINGTNVDSNSYLFAKDYSEVDGKEIENPIEEAGEMKIGDDSSSPKEESVEADLESKEKPKKESKSKKSREVQEEKKEVAQENNETVIENNQEEQGANVESKENENFKDLGDEEIPDFLKNENVEVIE